MMDAQHKSLRQGEYNQESIDNLPLFDPSDDPATQLDQKQRVDRLLVTIGRPGKCCRELMKLPAASCGVSQNSISQTSRKQRRTP